MARVIVVDDSRYLTDKIKEFLEEDGHEVVGIGHDGLEGVALYKESKPDLTLLDITMPIKDGRDCLAEILEYDEEAKVLMVSAIKDSSIVIACLKAGARSYVEKPLKFADPEFCEDFRSTIQKSLQGPES